MSRSVASMDKNEFRAASAASPNEPVSDLLGDQGGVAAGPVADYEVHWGLVFYSLIHDLNGILDHLQVQHKSINFPLHPLPP